MNRLERCCQCDDPTGRAGATEDSLYAAGGTPAELGPLCATCYETLTNEAALATANERIRWLHDSWQASNNENERLEEELSAKREVSDKLVAVINKAIHWAEHAMLMRSSQNKELLGILQEAEVAAIRAKQSKS